MTDALRVPTMAPGRVPLLGHAPKMKSRAGELFASLQNGATVSLIQVGRETMYVVNDPTLIREVLRDAETYVRGGPITQRFRAMFGNGLGISEGAFHRRQRAIIQPAFHRRRVADLVDTMSATATDTTGPWVDGARVDVDVLMDDLAMLNIIRLLFASGADLDRARFVAATGTVLGGLFQRMTDTTGVLAKLPTPANRRYREAARHIRTTIDRIIGEYRRQETDHGDLLSMMMFAATDDGTPVMTDQELHDEVMTFLIGGSNTVANTLSWAFHEIATHPHVEQRLHAEVDEVLAGRAVGYSDVARLDYTRRVLTETLRTRTQGLFMSRVAARDAALGGWRIPEGATVLYSFHALNSNPVFHPNPTEFDPDRWLAERARSIPRGAFIPFSLGVHGCIGDQFAWTEMIVTLASVTSRWRLVSVPGRVPRPKPAITMPVDALPMTVHRRIGSPAVPVAVSDPAQAEATAGPR
jgi:cyclooctat-9-en-7-ol 5-monooxygenase